MTDAWLGSRPLAVLAAAALVLAVLPGIAAAESRTGGTVVVEEDERTGDLEAVGGDVVVRGVVDGDLSAFAGSVRVEGEVTGSVEAAAGNVLVTGTVGEDVRAAGGHVEIGQTGTVFGDLEAAAGTVAIHGVVEGSARAGAGQITVGPTAQIAGDLEYDGELDRSERAEIGGEVVHNPDLDVAAGPLPVVPGVVFGVYFFLANLVLGVLLLAAFPGFARDLVDRTGDRPGLTGLVGLATLIGAPVALVVLALTVLGLPFSLAGFALYLLGIWLAIVYGRYLLGAWLLSLADRENRWLALLVGMLVMVVVRRLPVVGGAADLAVLVWGLGALVLGLYGRYRGRRPGADRAGEAPGTEAEPAAD